MATKASKLATSASRSAAIPGRISMERSIMSPRAGRVSQGMSEDRIAASRLAFDSLESFPDVMIGRTPDQLEMTSAGFGLQLEQEYGNPKVTPGGVDAYMRCPRCTDAPLSRHHVSYYVPVEVDRCRQCHGIWLDDKELDALLTDRKKMDKELGNKSVFAMLQQFMKGLAGGEG